MQKEHGRRNRPYLSGLDPGQYVLRSCLDELPLTADNGSDNVSITCVEHWDNNLYIGTSASELLHLVAIPAEDDNEPPTYTFASRLQPSGYAAAPVGEQLPGVQQILVLPGPSKACVLCNGVASFYTLPELSPASSGREQPGVQWIGGVDENEGVDNPAGHVIMLANAQHIRLIRVGEKLRAHKKVDFPSCLRSSRRETIACVANEDNYALLEVEHQQQIPLFAISSAPVTDSLVAQEYPSSVGHSRSKSLGDPLSPSASNKEDASLGPTHQSLGVPDPEHRAASPASVDSRGTRPRSSTDVTARRGSFHKARLKPHIVSPSPTEFLLTTGTRPVDAGVGLFVNLDGDVVRGTIEFSRYPEALLVYAFDRSVGANALDANDQSFIFALINMGDNDKVKFGLEIQQLPGTTEVTQPRIMVPIAASPADSGTGGLHRCLSPYRHSFWEVTSLLQASRYKSTYLQQSSEPDPRTKASIDRLEQETALFESQTPQPGSPTPEYEHKRNEDEQRLVSRLGQATTEAIVWSGRSLWQIHKNPLILQLEHALSQACRSQDATNDDSLFKFVDAPKILTVLGSIREREPENDTEFWTLSYVKQKASLILYFHLQAIMQSSPTVESQCQIVRSTLLEGGLDPRVVLSLIPPLARETLQGPNGIWLHRGILDILSDFKPSFSTFENAPLPFWLMLRQYLSEWQERRGYASIADEKFVFDSIDSALLHLLLYLDQALSRGSGAQKSTRAKLNNVVDNWEGNFHMAIMLLEHYNRLYALSRLYQSKRLPKDVLGTWRRIVEGEKDADDTVAVEEVEKKIGWYLTRIRNAQLVQEYGLWLARRNADLAIKAFTDDNSLVKLTPEEVVPILKNHAPNAVQQYLEHLVFTKNLDGYADDLIGYYLDLVLDVLETSEEARQSLKDSYTAYRAMSSPKPTYLNFITQNAPPQAWWQSRLRLLQLLGSGGYATRSSGTELSYSVDKVLDRLSPFSSSLVSESIILDARQGRHMEALRLLTHGLGDYDTAVRYCYFGGPAPSSSQPIDANLLPSRKLQEELFAHLFHEFVRIQDLEERLDRTSHLLGTFATWFDPLTILNEIPTHWTVDILAEFVLRSLRAAASERNQAIVMKALSASQNLQERAHYVQLCEKAGAKIVTEGQPPDPASQDLEASVA